MMEVVRKSDYGLATRVPFDGLHASSIVAFIRKR